MRSRHASLLVVGVALLLACGRDETSVQGSSDGSGGATTGASTSAGNTTGNTAGDGSSTATDAASVGTTAGDDDGVPHECNESQPCPKGQGCYLSLYDGEYCVDVECVDDADCPADQVCVHGAVRLIGGSCEVPSDDASGTSGSSGSGSGGASDSGSSSSGA